MGAIAFYDAQNCALDLFGSGKTEGTVKTNTPAANAGVVTRRSGIDNFVVAVSAFGATHDVAENQPDTTRCAAADGKRFSVRGAQKVGAARFSLGENGPPNEAEIRNPPSYCLSTS